ncbi:L-seryl-tRNA(Sec) selenium transferase [Myxococcota bacterium]|nr:L-seryl-tRNA(Sec) selenium transferase [Myxococcota bacterium]
MDSKPHVNTDPRRDIPSVHRLAERVCSEESAIAPWAAIEGARRVVERARDGLSQGLAAKDCLAASPEKWVERAAAEARQLSQPRPQRVVNATGVVLHTNLGRARMAQGAAEAAAEAAAQYSDLELDLESGERGDRLQGVGQRLALLSGAPAAFACNNCAAAVLLALNTLASGREVIVSRGELVEIGGSFRVPEIMQRAGVRLVEVGSTNRTHPRDYEDAIGPETALLLKVHRSNFEVTGFVAEVDLGALVEIGARHGVPVMEDLGSASLLDLTPHGFPEEAYAPARLALGPDLICFSGDKLMGGPQAGLVLGSAEVVQAMRSNPLARALRADKMTLAALDWTLCALLEGRGPEALPLLRQLLAAPESIEARAKALRARLADGIPAEAASLGVHRERVPVGGGSLPGFELESWAVVIRADCGAEALAARLRAAPVPVVARVREEAVWIDLRTVEPEETSIVCAALIAAFH